MPQVTQQVTSRAEKPDVHPGAHEFFLNNPGPTLPVLGAGRHPSALLLYSPCCHLPSTLGLLQLGFHPPYSAETFLPRMAKASPLGPTRSGDRKMASEGGGGWRTVVG